MHVLVTGGAGYVGSVVADGLLRAGHTVTILDNLQQGHREAVPEGARFIRADFCRPEDLDAAFRQSNPDAVMHMAGDGVSGSKESIGHHAADVAGSASD